MTTKGWSRDLGPISALSIAAAIWGFSFVAQRAAMAHIGPFLFNGMRFLLGAATLLPILVALRRRRIRTPARRSTSRAALLLGGAATGSVLFVAATLQQIGIVTTGAGKAGLITGLYVVLVPLLGIVCGARVRAAVWVSTLLAAGGLYLLSGGTGGTLVWGDVLLLLGALAWAVHVHLIGWMAERADPIAVAVAQSIVCGLLSLATAFATETLSLAAVRAAAPATAFAGFLSVGIAYTLQIVGQQRLDPSRAGVLLSLEAAFAVLGGWAILGEAVTVRMLVGCALMLSAMILSSAQHAGWSWTAGSRHRRPTRSRP
ncbi:MAG: DMT family transporter [Candidatus Bipolaricaulis sp.]|nr:DMT family transporter [Candidatus Bipolaricaulis sp.]